MHRLLLPAVIAVVCTAILFAVRGVAFRLLRRWSERSATGSGYVVAQALRIPSVYWCVAIGIYAGIAVSELSEKHIFYLSRTIHVIVIFSTTMAAANLSGNVFRNYVQRLNLPLPSTGLAYGILKGSIIAVGMLVILAVLGISIAPLITALGVGGLAVALALQDTLSNLFAGIHILIEKSIRLGDIIRLESGQEGCVEDITWRTTRVRTPSNNSIVVIPNNKLSQSVVTNYSLPEQRIAVQVQVCAGYDADPDLVEKVLLDEARQAAREGALILDEPSPSVSLAPGFRESCMEFTLVCHVAAYHDQTPVQSALRKRILKRFRQEGIEIPNPQRTVFIRDEKGQPRL